MDLRVLHDDPHILIVNKPPELLSVPGRGGDRADCVVARAASRYPGIREVHRLDQSTSGILMLAKTPEAHRRLSMDFAARHVLKVYQALVARIPRDTGVPGLLFEKDAGRISLFQHLDVARRPRQMAVPGPPGRKAITDWSILERQDGVVRLELRPLTGRTHQLRLALAVCDAPVLGDRLYATGKIRDAAGRLMLHATFLSFSHPETGETMEISCRPEF